MDAKRTIGRASGGGIGDAEVLTALLDDLAERVAAKLLARLPLGLVSPLGPDHVRIGKGKGPKRVTGATSSEDRGGRNVATHSQEQRVLRPAAAARKLGISRSTLYRWEKAGAIPSRMQLGANAVGWYERDLDKFLEHRPLLRC